MSKQNQSGTARNPSLPSDALALEVFGLVEDLSQMARYKAGALVLNDYKKSSECPEVYKETLKIIEESFFKVLTNKEKKLEYSDCVKRLFSDRTRLTTFLVQNPDVKDCLSANMGNLQLLDTIWLQSQHRMAAPSLKMNDSSSDSSKAASPTHEATPVVSNASKSGVIKPISRDLTKG